MLPPVKRAQKIERSAWIEVRLDRLIENLNALRAMNPGAAVLAVVKANAYGHGLLDIAKALERRVRFLGVSSVAEALELKEHGIESPIFLFGRPLSFEIRAVLTEGITLSVSSLDEAREISELSEFMHRRTPVHVKVDTGMGRLGIPYSQSFKMISRIAELPGILLDGIYTHFPTAEARDGFAERQLSDFNLLLRSLESKLGIRFRFRHAANSAASVRLAGAGLNLIRPGLMLYGIYPDKALAKKCPVRPALSLKSRIILVKELRAGESAGYGRDFTARRPTTIGVLPVGYSHGYPFACSRRASVLYKGGRFPLAGRVSMDYVSVDFGSRKVSAGDEVTLIGEEKRGSVTAEELAALAGTIPYEIVTRLNPRLPRIYLP